MLKNYVPKWSLFQVPGVPFVPMVSILLNVYLMVSLDAETWAKFLAWMVLGDTLHCTHKYRISISYSSYLLGFIIYFTYGVWHSKASDPHLPDIQGYPKLDNDEDTTWVMMRCVVKTFCLSNSLINRSMKDMKEIKEWEREKVRKHKTLGYHWRLYVNECI